MYILGITGSPKGAKSQTRRLMESVLAGAQATGATTELVDLSTLDVKYCTACGACYAKGACVINDDYPPLLAKMLVADGLVFGSPLYFSSCTAQFKTMLDRMADPIHTQRFLGKYGCAVATSGGPEFPEVNDYLTNVLVRFGAFSVGSVGCAAMMPGAMERALPDATALGGTLAQAIADRPVFADQQAIHAAMHARFKALVTMSQERFPYEYAYWQQQGWLD